MEDLTSDLVLEILNRLPIKSFLQCRSVCKIWRNLLGKSKTGMIFTKKPVYYYNDWEIHYIEQFSEMLVNSNSTQEQPQNFDKNVTEIASVFTGFYGFNLIGSCNGLVCYSTWEPNLGVVIYIFNTITGERVRFLSKKPTSTFPLEIFVCAGFGYCHSDDSTVYKLVKIFYFGNDGKQHIQVCTLGDGNGWRDKPEISYNFSKSCVFANGALHWLINVGGSKCDIVAFDVADETFRSIPPPVCYFPSNSSISVTLEGDLCLCLPEIKQGEPMMDVWVFKKKNINNCRRGTPLKECTYINSFTWIKVFSNKVDSGSTCQLLSLSENDIILWQNGVISCYDLKATTSTKLWCTEGAKGYVQATPHMHSLISLKDLGEKLVDVKDCIFLN